MPAQLGLKSKRIRISLALLLALYAAPATWAAPGGDNPSPTEKELVVARVPSAERAGSSLGVTPPVSPRDQSNQRPSRFSPAGELNRHLPSWLRFDGQYQARLEDGFSGRLFRPDGGDTYFLNRIRLGVTIRPSDRLSFHVEDQDARAVDKNPPHTSGFYDLFEVRQ